MEEKKDLEQVIAEAEEQAEEAANALFAGGGDSANVPTYQLKDEDLQDGKIDIMGLLVATGLCSSRGDARRNIQQGGVTVDDEKITDISVSYTADDFAGEGKLVKRGKKNFIKVVK